MVIFAYAIFVQLSLDSRSPNGVSNRSSTPGNTVSTDTSAASQLWSGLVKEIQGTHGVTSEHAEREESRNEANFSARNETQSTFTGFSLGQFGGAQLHSLALRPAPAVIFALCNVYLDQVDRVIKVLHRPSLKRHLVDGHSYAVGRSSVNAENALDAAVFYAAVASMTDRQCQSLFHCDRATVLPEYQKACEMALNRADLTRTRDITVLQAFVLYLVRFHSQKERRNSAVSNIFDRLPHEPTISRVLYGLSLPRQCGLLTRSICMSTIHQKVTLADRCEKGYGLR